MHLTFVWNLSKTHLVRFGSIFMLTNILGSEKCYISSIDLFLFLHEINYFNSLKQFKLTVHPSTVIGRGQQYTMRCMFYKWHIDQLFIEHKVTIFWWTMWKHECICIAQPPFSNFKISQRIQNKTLFYWAISSFLSSFIPLTTSALCFVSMDWSVLNLHINGIIVSSFFHST